MYRPGIYDDAAPYLRTKRHYFEMLEFLKQNKIDHMPNTGSCDIAIPLDDLERCNDVANLLARQNNKDDCIHAVDFEFNHQDYNELDNFVYSIIRIKELIPVEDWYYVYKSHLLVCYFRNKADANLVNLAVRK